MRMIIVSCRLEIPRVIHAKNNNYDNNNSNNNLENVLRHGRRATIKTRSEVFTRNYLVGRGVREESLVRGGSFKSYTHYTSLCNSLYIMKLAPFYGESAAPAATTGRPNTRDSA